MTQHKLFSLLHGKEVRLAGSVKRIPASEFSTMQSAQELVQTVQKDAEAYRIEVVKECEILREAAQREGFDEGFASWAQDIKQLEEERKALRQAMEKTIIPVALKAARKIVGREIELTETAVVDIVSQHLKSVAQHKKITIYTSRQDYGILERHRDHLKKLFESLESLSIQPKEGLTRGSFIIETDRGIINAQLEQVWEILEKVFVSSKL